MSNNKTAQWVEVTQKIWLPHAPDRDKIVYEDGIPMESDWHRAAMNLLIEIITYLWRDRQDYYVGGNMFIYFDPDQVRKRNFRGPDFFVVQGIADNTRWREAWVLWEEDDRGPDIVIELTSQSTEAEDRGPKKDIYEHILQVPEYMCYNPETESLFGWRLVNERYQAIQPNEQGRLWSETLALWVGTWQGDYLERPNLWLRFFDVAGRLILTGREAEAEHAEAEAERAEAEAKRAQTETERAEAEAEARRAAEAELARLRTLLKQQRGEDD